MRNFKSLVILFFLIQLSACAATRTTTTEHTAVEQALLSYTASKAFHTIDFSKLAGSNVFIEKIVLPHRYPRPNLGTTSQWHEINPNFLRSLLERELLKAGATVLEKKESSDLSLDLVCDVAAIDDSEFVMGLPSIPIPVAGSGTVSTPEISLFSSKRQAGKVRFSVIGKKDGKIAFMQKSKAARKYYSRWSMLIVLGWRFTDLGAPF